MQKPESQLQQPDGEGTGPYMTFRCTAAQAARLTVEARAAGITVGELIRRMVGGNPLKMIASAQAKVAATEAARLTLLTRRMVHEHLTQMKVKASARAKGRASNA